MTFTPPSSLAAGSGTFTVTISGQPIAVADADAEATLAAIGDTLGDVALSEAGANVTLGLIAAALDVDASDLLTSDAA